MIFNYKNISYLNEEYMHDSVFEGYIYDYENRQIKMSCVDGLNREKRNYLIFYDVIYSEMQSCEFWSPQNCIYDLWYEVNTPQMDKLKKMLHTGGWNNKPNRLTEGTHYIQIVLQLISGDMLLVICESIKLEKRGALESASLIQKIQAAETDSKEKRAAITEVELWMNLVAFFNREGELQGQGENILSQSAILWKDFMWIFEEKHVDTLDFDNRLEGFFQVFRLIKIQYEKMYISEIERKAFAEKFMKLEELNSVEKEKYIKQNFAIGQGDMVLYEILKGKFRQLGKKCG